VGLSLVQSLDPDATLGLRLKWPNDVWVARPGTATGWGKLAGILIETAVATGRARGPLAPTPTPAAAPRYCVVGVGINIAPPTAQGLSTEPLGLQTLLANITAPQALQRVAPPLLSTLLAFQSPGATGGFAPLHNAFHARDALRDLTVSLSDGRIGVARGVNAVGALQVETAQGLEEINSSEVSVRPQ
jgi:BirA family biotin operon repressor/biotin-[acetyl-CoA-carboxylase] ligase